VQLCLELLAMAARSDASVLILGETGTGKELFAWAIHNNSARADRPFVVVDCASLPETLVESTLLGYEKGAFTGAFRDHDGLVKQADGGTLFLDEVSELPLSVQKSFLRVLQERRFRHVGGVKEIESNFRLIAASNRDLDAMVQHRQFRKDLLFRLRGFTIELPPLREHPEDIAALSDYHMAQLCGCYGIKKKGYSPDFFEALARYNWPGNVRELVNALERAVAAARHEPILFPKHLPTYIRVQLARSSVAPDQDPQQTAKGTRGPEQSFPRLADVRETAIAHVERRYLKELIAQSKGDVQKACRIAGLSRSRLYALLKKYQISTSVMLSR
jgi:two-component system NtrC family response regulator